MVLVGASSVVNPKLFCPDPAFRSFRIRIFAFNQGQPNNWHILSVNNGKFIVNNGTVARFLKIERFYGNIYLIKRTIL
jgi:hypothetical protein